MLLFTQPWWAHNPGVDYTPDTGNEFVHNISWNGVIMKQYSLSSLFSRQICPESIHRYKDK